MSVLDGIFELPYREPPKCSCGAVIGIATFDNQNWCPDCLWAKIQELQAKINLMEKS